MSVLTPTPCAQVLCEAGLGYIAREWHVLVLCRHDDELSIVRTHGVALTPQEFRQWINPDLMSCSPLP